MKALYCCCIVNPWLEVAKKLKQKNIIPKYWIGWNDDNEGRIQKELPETTFHDIDLAWKGIFPEGIKDLDRPQLDGFELSTHTYEELMGIKMLDRLDPDQSSFTFNERQQFFRRLLRRWLNVLQVEKIQLVIAPSIPHRVFDYAIYVATKILNIEFLSFKMTAWPGKLLPVRDITKVPNIPEGHEDSESEIEDQVRNYVARIQADYEQAEPDYMKKQQSEAEVNLYHRIARLFVKKNTELITSLFKPSTAYWKKKDKLIQDSVYTNLEKLIQKYRGIKFKNDLQEKYEALCTEPNFNDKYLFVALHYQPEETSCPSGNIYVDQSIMIEALLKAFPEEIKIYVKEHPSQFNPKMEGQAGRNDNFYHSINDFKRVQFISNTIESFELIDQAVSIATLTGTVGIEGLLRKKPVIVFGNAWYENLPGVFKIDSQEKLLNLSKNILSKEYISVQKITQSLNSLYQFCISANHYKGINPKSSISNEESTRNLVKYIATHY